MKNENAVAGDKGCVVTVDVDQSVVRRTWFLRVADCGGKPNAVLYTAEGQQIDQIVLEFVEPDFIFLADITLCSEPASSIPSYLFKEYVPANLNGVASCVTLISLSDALLNLSLGFRCAAEENANLTFNLEHLSGDGFVSQDPDIAIRRKIG